MKRIFIAVSALALIGCSYDPTAGGAPGSVRSQEATKAAKAANATDFSAGNAEIDNISKRQKLVADPGLVGFLMTVSFGRPMGYYQIKGKVTSCGKRLERDQELIEADLGEWNGQEVVDAPSYDGTFGNTDPNCKFFYTVSGQYVQTSMDYTYSDQPLTFDSKSAIELVK